MFPEINQYRKSAVSETSCAERGEKVPRNSAAAVAAAPVSAPPSPTTARTSASACRRQSSIVSARSASESRSIRTCIQDSRKVDADSAALPDSPATSSSTPSGPRRLIRIGCKTRCTVTFWMVSAPMTESTSEGMSSVTMSMTVLVSVQPGLPSTADDAGLNTRIRTSPGCRICPTRQCPSTIPSTSCAVLGWSSGGTCRK
jgi:hypothetical protein